MDKIIIDNPFLNFITDKMILSQFSFLKRFATFVALALALMVYGIESIWHSMLFRGKIF